MSGFENQAVDPGPDKNDFTDPFSTFPSLYQQEGSVVMELDKYYVLNMTQCGD